MSKVLRVAVAPIVALAMVGGSEDAAATTFCVPSVAAACSETAGAIGKADLEEAMSLQASDGVSDTIRVAAGTFKEGGAGFEPAGGSTTTFEATGADPLTIVGSGPGATIMTSTSSANDFVVNLSFNNTRAVTIRDLTIQMPATQPDGLGAGILLYNGDVLDNVDLVSLNDDGDGVVEAGAGNVFRNGELRGGQSEGSIGDGFGATNVGTLLVEDSTVRGASWALVGSGGGSLIARRVNVVDARTYGAIAGSGSVAVENSVMTIDDGTGLYVSASANDVTLDANHVTIVNSGSGEPAIEGRKFGSGAGDATMTVSNSILRGFSSGYFTETMFGPGIGVTSLVARYSNLPQTGTSLGGNVDFSSGNIDADPLLETDYSLPANSPSVDAGDPAAGGPATDFLGAPRPIDGDGDGVAVRDQGAFEYQRPVPPAEAGSRGGQPGGGSAGGNGSVGDRVAPKTTIVKGPGAKLAWGKAKFSFASSEAGGSFQCKLDRGRVASCGATKRYRHLAPGPHTFKVWAVDAAGNKDPTPAKRRFRVPG